MPKKTKLSEDEIAAFHKAVEGTKPLAQKKIRLSPPSTSRKVIKRKHYEEEEPILFSEKQVLATVGGEEFIAHKQAAISNKTLRKLRKGQYNVDAILDLHGLSVEEAKIAVESFLQQCLRQGIRVVLIIHGKGRHNQMPILKNKLNHWLREIDVVLAFCSAASSHGSRGALYVLLKSTTEENLFE